MANYDSEELKNYIHRDTRKDYMRVYQEEEYRKETKNYDIVRNCEGTFGAGLTIF